MRFIIALFAVKISRVSSPSLRKTAEGQKLRQKIAQTPNSDLLFPELCFFWEAPIIPKIMPAYWAPAYS
jgi:hypothetical protein